MKYESNEELAKAIAYVKRWKEIEGGKLKSASIIREQMKCMNDTATSHRTKTFRIAALSLLMAGLEITAGNIAWLVRDMALDFPERPTFAF